ncbi:hypothetical protein TNCV_4296551 [Trichonephila clavipes]|nr:hypothetical protein TNCV_4296551 [Trichonephila clavipes]
MWKRETLPFNHWASIRVTSNGHFSKQQGLRHAKGPCSIESKEGSQEMEEFPPGIGQYGDFHTIDWQRDLSRDTYRQKYITRKMKESWWKLLKGYYDKLSGWLCVFLVGVAAGSVAGFIDIGEGWMKDLKEGICPEAFWLNKEQCCWSSNETFYEGDECDQVSHGH